MGERTISTREAEILDAVGERLTNAQIAARLVISVRTVESHVSALLRKLDAANRQDLVAVAARRRAVAAPAEIPGMPVPLTSFVGRADERADLAAAIGRSRLVTVVGPGGIGKTRLAMAAAASTAESFPDGVWFVDLVPAIDADGIMAAIGTTVGVGEPVGASLEESVVRWAAGRTALLVLDNCEHLLDDVAVAVEQILTRARNVTVVCTSRARMRLPFEAAFAVPGLSLPGTGTGDGDAVALFVERAAAGGVQVLADERERIGRIGRALDGVALAIELAAARLPAVGLDGLESGLVAERLELLSGSRRLEERHRSLRATLDWSVALLPPAARAVLRRVAVFAGPFATDAAAEVAAGHEVTGREIAPGLATLAEHSLVVPVIDGVGTRYRLLETIRQYGAELAERAGESGRCRDRHRRWALAECAVLLADPDSEAARWRSAVDRHLEELRSSLAFAAERSAGRADAHELAAQLAALSRRRGRPGEAQRSYERAATLAGSAAEAAADLHEAASSAAVRMAADEAVRLHRAAADACIDAGDRGAAAIDLAQAAELVNRARGCFVVRPPAGTVAALLTQARGHAGTDPRALARIGVAEAFDTPDRDPATEGRAVRALDVARASGDPLTECAALDRITTVQLARGEVRAARHSANLRVELLDRLPADTYPGFELPDAYVMAAECAVAVGDLAGGRHYAERIRDMAVHQDDGHLAAARLTVVTALAGAWDETDRAALLFREGWDRAGRPPLQDVRRAACAVTAVHRIRGQERAAAEWATIADTLGPAERTPEDKDSSGAFFDAFALLHLGRPQEAAAALAPFSAPPRGWLDGMWRPWCAALEAEAAVLAGGPSGEHAEPLATARAAARENPVAMAIVERAAALAAGDGDLVLGTADTFDELGCRYQRARSLLLAGGRHRALGAQEMAALGATGA